MRITPVAVFLSLALLGLTACSSIGGVEGEAKYPTGMDRTATDGDIYAQPKSIFGEGGLLGANKKKGEGDETSGIGVNAFLWRAALDTVSFMPLASADPFGGVILTDWYAPPENDSERFKLNVFILGKQLRSDGVRVRVFRQVMNKGTWRDEAPAEGMETKLEDTILTRARQLRVAQLN